MKFGAQGWPVEGTVFPIKDVDVRMEDGQHSFEAAHEAEIAANWQREVKANPALYNGKILMQEEISLQDGVLRATGRLAFFSTLLWWRKQARPSSGYTLVGTAVPVSSDGAIIAIRMASHTANPGKVYCAAGSLDGSDVTDGRCDVIGNMTRELLEETSLDIAESTPDGPLYATWTGRRAYVFRLHRFPMTAEQICAQVRRHMADQFESEIDDVLPIRSADPNAQNYDSMTRLLLPFFFEDVSRATG
ncbi:NUDIX hydrolase [Rhizobium oryzicola]|uniref:NUDIX hydrolase n=1 Tax=Rhizobium oryzicola TaxID=1232668 RepID=A0ABT8T117_9HYPH|nr:NUDIX hydrolase [Rhizobium oryzicola]MDO1584417.1 NUDIX hydrolase [Rhizobium oryzicola]